MINSTHISAIFNALPGGCLLILADIPQFTIVGLNEAFCRSGGILNGSVINKGLFEALPKPAVREEEIRQCLATVVSSKVTRTINLISGDTAVQPPDKPDTTYRDFEISPILNAAGKVDFLLCRARDEVQRVAGAGSEDRRRQLEMNLLIRNTEESFLLVDTELRVVSFNKQFLQLCESHFGFHVEKGRLISDYIHSRRVEVVRRTYDKVFSGEEIIQDMSVPVPYGSDLVYRLKYKPARDEMKKVVGAFVTIKDITESEQVKALLVHNEAKFRAFFENTMDSIFLTTPDGRILSANPAACALFEMTELEICQAGRTGLVDTNDPRLDHLLQERRKNGKAKGELQFLRKNGSKFPAEISSSIFTDACGEERTSMIIRDITDKKKAEAAIEHGIQRFNYVIQATSDVIWDWDLSEETNYWGEGFETIFGYAPQNEFNRKSWKERIHPEDFERILKEICLLIDGTEANWAAEYRYLKADGTFAFVADRGLVIRNEQGKATRMVGAMQDITKRKNGEFALQQSESRLKGIIASQTNYILRIDLDGNYSYYNQKFMNDFGWIHEEDNLIGLDSRRSIMEYHRSRVTETAQKCLSDLNQVFQVEIDKPTRNGGVKTTFWDFVCLADSEGKPVELQCIGIDITDKKKAETDLITTLEEKNMILESIGDAFFAVDRNWTVTYWNRQAEIMLNTPKSSVVGHHLWDVFPDSIDSISYVKYHEAISSKQPVLFEEFYPSLSRWYEVSAYPTDKGLSVYFKDVTERKHNIYALNLSEQRFKALVQEGSDLISILDERGHYKFLSPAYQTVLGLQPDEMAGAKAVERIHNEDRDAVAQTSALLKTQKRVQYLPYRYRAGNDHYRWLESVATNLTDDPAIEGIIYNSKEVTERMNYIQAVEEQNTKLREIAWIQSHLVRAPVSRILGLVTLLREHKDKANETELLAHIYESTQELDRLIRDIVDKSRKVDFPSDSPK